MSAAPDWKPSPKVVGGGVAGAVTTIVLWLLDELTPLSPPAVVAGAISLLVTVGVAYWIPGARRQAEDRLGDEPPLTEHERQAVRQAFQQAAQQATVTLRVRGSQAAEQELAEAMFDWFKRRGEAGG